MSKTRKLEISAVDSLLVFRSDGTYEASLPDVAGDTIPENVITAAMITYALQDEEIMDLLYKNLQKHCRNF